MRRRQWSRSEERVLVDEYPKKTIKELENLFPERSRESINNKIKRLKAQGRISDDKLEDAVKRAYEQRGEKVVDSNSEN